MSSARARLVTFAVVVVMAMGGAVGYVLMAARGESTAALAPSPGTSASPGFPPPGDFIAFRRTAVDAGYGTVGTVPVADPAAAPAGSDLSCERLHLSRTGGVCLQVDRAAVTTARVLLLRGDLSVRHSLSTPGIPSRARVSPDGRWAATTTFVVGHSYAQGGFSTQTEIYDMESGDSLGNVETFAVSRRGRPYSAPDVNVWGVTFAGDGTSFYATVMTGGTKYLARGDIGTRSLVMLDVPAECPSLSPDGRLLAYKSATGPTTWEVRVRALADGSEAVVDAPRSVDDQIEWLDDDHVVFGLAPPGGGARADVWVAPADGSAPAEVLIPAAWSPAVVRAG
ncbi:PD40 domain-containing protein [Knoellia aerolata]|uniref:TolB n=1 Tax=Knoellia aerolata DSM 18566 TaxID=1385519 RepID=A0A0A0K0C9_9MICO|nr:PD40 domain-containing protein [Knoellia aerolata]KGN41241.1 hypothetical protein N801_02230 [Knoellia aerolata DSM 18566]